MIFCCKKILDSSSSCVWKADTCEHTSRTIKAFPDATNGSRVLITTRKEDVANHVQMATTFHALNNLDDEKSRLLFNRKSLPSYIRSKKRGVVEFEELGSKLARKCDRLPLALAVLRGYL